MEIFNNQFDRFRHYTFFASFWYDLKSERENLKGREKRGKTDHRKRGKMRDVSGLSNLTILWWRERQGGISCWRIINNQSREGIQKEDGAAAGD